jgi:uncharacterized protein (TIGR03083 family)
MSDSTAWIRALRGSHDRLAALLSPLGDDAITGPSYDTDWSIAQVVSHLGSQAEIFALSLDAGLTGGDPPAQEKFQEIWARWDNSTPREQVDNSLAVDEALVSRLEAMSDAERDGFTLAMFGNELDLAGFAGMRLGEAALHTWDIAVELDPKATVAPDAVELMVDRLPALASRFGKPAAEGRTVVIETTDPARTFRLTTGPEVAMTVASGPADLRLPAEALLRLLYGRLDAEHSPTDDAILADLRPVFPGF